MIALLVAVAVAVYRQLITPGECRGSARIMGIADIDPSGVGASSKEEALALFLRASPWPNDGYVFGPRPDGVPASDQTGVEEVAWAIRSADRQLRTVAVERTSRGWTASRSYTC